MKLDIPEGDFDAYIFDCDGTLADSMPLHYDAFVAAFKKLGVKEEFSKEKYYAWAGAPMMEVISRMNDLHGLDLDHNEVARWKDEFYHDLIDTVKPIDAVVDVLKSIVGKLKIGVASGGARYCVERTLKNIKIDHLVEAVVTADDVKHGKPAPDIFLKAAELLGVDPAKCLVFEDGQLGIDSAKAAGMQVVFVDSL